MRRRIIAVLGMLGLATIAALPAAATACATSRNDSLKASAGFAAGDERKVVKSARLRLSVSSLEKARAEVERIVVEADGLIESSDAEGDERVSLSCRVPSERLEPVIDQLAALGDVTGRSLSKADVTERWTDLETHLKNSIALRDRLRMLLERANSVADVIAVEKELTRVQSDVETLQSQFDRLRGQVSLSTLDVTLDREQVLGPLGWIGWGVWWAVRKLFIID